MILLGEKKEEYREKSDFYTARLKKYLNAPTPVVIRLRNGYKRDSPFIDILVNINLGQGRIEWGAEQGKIYYVLKINTVFLGGFL